MKRRQLTMLIWKELEEDRWAFYAGTAAFVVLPIFASVVSVTSTYTADVTVALGTLLAVLVGCGTACRDLGAGVENFWRSRAVDPTRWMLIKYLVGLVVVLAINVLALAGQAAVTAWIGWDSFGFEMAICALLYNTPVLVLAFSVAFLLGCLVRSAVPAALLSTVAALVICCVPVISPALGWLNAYALIERGLGVFTLPSWEATRPLTNGQLAELYFHGAGRLFTLPGSATFMAVMLGASLILALLAGVVVRQDRRWNVDAKAVVWVLGCVVLAFFGIGATTLGTNLRVERWVDLTPPGQPRDFYVDQVVLHGRHGVARTRRLSHATDWNSTEPTWQVRAIDLDLPRPIDMGPIGSIQTPTSWRPLVWSDEAPDRVFYLIENLDANDSLMPLGAAPRSYGAIGVADLHGHVYPPVAFPPEATPWSEFAGIFQADGRLYTYFLPDWRRLGPSTRRASDLQDDQHQPTYAPGMRPSGAPTVPCLIIDSADPVHSRVKRIIPGPRPGFDFGGWGRGELVVNLPRLPGVGARQRLNALAHNGDWRGDSRWSDSASLEGDLLATEGGGPQVWRLTSLTDDQAHFELAGGVERSSLERLADAVAGRYPWWWNSQLLIHHKMLYVGHHGVQVGVDVYDLHDPTHPRHVGHFAAPDDIIGAMVGLPDGRVLVAGSRLYVLAPPTVAGPKW